MNANFTSRTAVLQHLYALSIGPDYHAVVYLSVRSNALLVDGHRNYDAGVGHSLTQGLALGCVKEADDCASECTQLQSGSA